MKNLITVYLFSKFRLDVVLQVGLLTGTQIAFHWATYRVFFKADLGVKNDTIIFQLHHDLGFQRNTISFS